MKECPKCEKRYFDNCFQCPKCEEKLIECDTFLDAFYEKTKNQKTIIIIALIIISFALGFALHYTFGIKTNVYLTLQGNYEKLKTQKDELSAEYQEYKEKMQPYEEQLAVDIKAREEKEKQEAEAKASKEAEENSAKKKAEAEVAKAKEVSEKETKAKQSPVATSSSSSKVITKDYKPTGNEPNWIAIVSACEVQMPELIGYDANISLDENDTQIIKTGLRYKIETNKLKIKADKSYHKAILIIEFENEKYENFRVSTVEVDRNKIK